MLISNIDIDTIDDTFEISISVSMILSYKSIDRGIDDTFWPFLSTLHRYFSADMQNDAHNFLSFRVFVHVQRSVEILDERTGMRVYHISSNRSPRLLLEARLVGLLGTRLLSNHPVHR